jgi:hypothetical protein
MLLSHESHESHGAGELNRTPDLLITDELLYRLSYTGKGSQYPLKLYLNQAFIASAAMSNERSRSVGS